MVLRGGNGKPNYDSVHLALCEQELTKAGITPNIMVDCSHANSNKKPELQPLVIDNVTNQILEGNNSIVGLMVESNLLGQSIDSEGSEQTAIRRIRHRRLHRLGDDGKGRCACAIN